MSPHWPQLNLQEPLAECGLALSRSGARRVEGNAPRRSAKHTFEADTECETGQIGPIEGEFWLGLSLPFPDADHPFIALLMAMQDEVFPVFHQLTPFINQLPSSVSGTGTVAVDVSQGKLRHFLDVASVLLGPCPECSAKPMSRHIMPHRFRYLADRNVRDRLTSAGAGKHAFIETGLGFQQLYGHRGQWHLVGFATLHPITRNSPQLRFQVDLIPSCASLLPGAGRSQDKELQDAGPPSSTANNVTL